MFKNLIIKNSFKIENLKLKIDLLVVVLSCLLLVIVALIVGAQSSAFSGFPKGYDSFDHLAIIKIIEDNFPHIFWNPYWDFGTVLFPRNYPPLYHFSLGILARIFSLDVASLIVKAAAVNIILTTLAIFGTVYLLGRRIFPALAGGAFYLASSTVWSYLLSDGLYSRVFAQMTLSLAILALVFYFRRIIPLEVEPPLKSILLRGSTSGTGDLPFRSSPTPKAMASEGGWPYYLLVFAFTAAILSHFLSTILLVFTFFLLLFWLFPRFDDRVVLTVKIFAPVAGLCAFFYLPLLSFGLGKQGLLGTFGGDPYTPLPLGQLFSQKYPGMPFLSIPLFLFLPLLVFLTRGREDLRSKRHAEFSSVSKEILKQVQDDGGGSQDDKQVAEKVFWLAGFLSFLAFLYVLGLSGKIFYGIYPIQFLAPAVFFLSIFIGLGLFFLLERQILNAKFLALISIGFFTLALAQSLQFKKLSQDQSKVWPSLFFKTLDEDRLFRFAHRNEALGGAFNYYSGTLQSRGYYEVGVLFPDFHFWFEEEVFGRNDNPEETRYFLDWYGIKGLYTGRLTKRGEPFGITAKLTPENFAQTADYEWVYNNASPILEAVNTPVILVKAEDATYRKILIGLSSKGEGSKALITVRVGNDMSLDKTKLPVVSSWLQVEDILGKVSTPSAEMAETKQKATFVNSQRRELELEDKFQGALLRESYFRNWHAWLERSKVNPSTSLRAGGQKSKVDLKIYQAGPGVMYVFLPDYEGPAKVIFEYRQSFIEQLGILISFITLVLVLLSWAGLNWKRKIFSSLDFRRSRPSHFEKPV